MAPRDNSLKVGLLVGHTEAICTGTLAGYNAARHVRKESPLVIPGSLAVGDAIGHVRTQMRDDGKLDLKYTFSGSVLFERMEQLNLYTTDTKKIEARVGTAGMTGVFAG